MALRLLHTSDVHIGHATGVGDHLDTCICPVLAVLDAVRTVDADVLLVAGDLFDHGRLPPPVVDGVLSVLGAADVPVVLMPGNHDVHDDSSVWHRAELGGVFLLDDHAGSTVSLLDGELHVWGRAMPEHDRSYRPIADAPSRPGDGAYVVMGHGFHETDDSMRSSPITPDDIAATGADYVALGHIHVRLDVSAGGIPAWYCGAPVGITSSGTCNVVTIDVDAVAVDAVDVELPARGCAEVAIPV